MFEPKSYRRNEVDSILNEGETILTIELIPTGEVEEDDVQIAEANLSLHIIKCRMPHYKTVSMSSQQIDDESMSICFEISNNTLGVEDYQSILHGDAFDFVGASKLQIIEISNGMKRDYVFEFRPEHFTGQFSWWLSKEE